MRRHIKRTGFFSAVAIFTLIVVEFFLMAHQAIGHSWQHAIFFDTILSYGRMAKLALQTDFGSVQFVVEDMRMGKALLVKHQTGARSSHEQHDGEL